MITCNPSDPLDLLPRGGGDSRILSDDLNDPIKRAVEKEGLLLQIADRLQKITRIGTCA
jgi:hypothetical protein